MSGALNIATHGKAGAVSALGLASFGRIGRRIIILVPIEFTEFTFASLFPSEISDVEIESSQLVLIPFPSESGTELALYRAYVVMLREKTIVEVEKSLTGVELLT